MTHVSFLHARYTCRARLLYRTLPLVVLCNTSHEVRSMANTGENPVQVEPLSKKEVKEQGASTRVEEDPDFPKEWKERGAQIREMVGKGFKYYKRNVGDKVYMLLRKGRFDRGLGQWTEEKEQKLFTFFPTLDVMGKIQRPAPFVPSGRPQGGHSFLGVPIARVAIIPREYVPSINVIRYFEIVKENGFPNDFSKFINDIVTHHMRDCHGIKLPVMIEDGAVELRRDDDVVETVIDRR